MRFQLVDYLFYKDGISTINHFLQISGAILCQNFWEYFARLNIIKALTSRMSILLRWDRMSHIHLISKHLLWLKLEVGCSWESSFLLYEISILIYNKVTFLELWFKRGLSFEIGILWKHRNLEYRILSVHRELSYKIRPSRVFVDIIERIDSIRFRTTNAWTCISWQLWYFINLQNYW